MPFVLLRLFVFVWCCELVGFGSYIGAQTLMLPQEAKFSIHQKMEKSVKRLTPIHVPGYLPKTSLVTILHYLADPLKRGTPLETIPSELNPTEFAFVKSTQQKPLDDLFLEPENTEDMRYVGFAPHRSEEQTENDEQIFSAGSQCYRVHVKNDNSTMFKKKLGLFLNFRPSGYNASNSWYFSYCFGEDFKSDDSILYYFHGVGGSPRGWINFAPYSEIREIWRKQGDLPKWVSVSVGKVGLVSLGNWERRFVEIIAPYVESELGYSKQKPPKNRYGVGISMGGANLTHFLLNRPSFFSKGFLICPAISTVDPNSTEEEISDFIERTGPIAWVLRIMLSVLPSEYSDPNYFAKIDPLISGQKLLGSKTAGLYIQTSTHDEFGFEEGGRVFALLARARGARVEFNELVGGHCMLQPGKLVDFFRK